MIEDVLYICKLTISKMKRKCKYSHTTPLRLKYIFSTKKSPDSKIYDYNFKNMTVFLVIAFNDLANVSFKYINNLNL